MKFRAAALPFVVCVMGCVIAALSAGCAPNFVRIDVVNNCKGDIELNGSVIPWGQTARVGSFSTGDEGDTKTFQVTRGTVTLGDLFVKSLEVDDEEDRGATISLREPDSLHLTAVVTEGSLYIKATYIDLVSAQ